MRHRGIWLFGALLAFGPARLLADDVLAPITGTVLALSIGERQSTYYRLNRDSVLDVSATGPGSLTAIVRLTIPKGFKADSAYYRMVVMEKADTVRDVTAATADAEADWIAQSGEACLSRKFSFTVPANQHLYHFRLAQADGPYAGVRFLLKHAGSDAKESPLYPIAMERMLTLIYRERRLDYHLATANQPVKVHVIGPTRLRVITRLVFGPMSKGEQKYAVDLLLDQKKVNTEEMSTTKSVTSEFEEEPQWVPGKSRTVYLPIPSGAHDVTVSPRATDAPGVAMRFTLPSQDVANEEKD